MFHFRHLGFGRSCTLILRSSWWMACSWGFTHNLLVHHRRRYNWTKIFTLLFLMQQLHLINGSVNYVKHNIPAEETRDRISFVSLLKALKLRSSFCSSLLRSAGSKSVKSAVLAKPSLTCKHASMIFLTWNNCSVN